MGDFASVTVTRTSRMQDSPFLHSPWIKTSPLASLPALLLHSTGVATPPTLVPAPWKMKNLYETRVLGSASSAKAPASFLTSSWRMEANPPFLQLSACSTLNPAPQPSQC